MFLLGFDKEWNCWVIKASMSQIFEKMPIFIFSITLNCLLYLFTIFILCLPLLGYKLLMYCFIFFLFCFFFHSVSLVFIRDEHSRHLKIVCWSHGCYVQRIAFLHWLTLPSLDQVEMDRVQNVFFSGPLETRHALKFRVFCFSSFGRVIQSIHCVLPNTVGVGSRSILWSNISVSLWWNGESLNEIRNTQNNLMSVKAAFD